MMCLAVSHRTYKSAEISDIAATLRPTLESDGALILSAIDSVDEQSRHTRDSCWKRVDRVTSHQLLASCTTPLQNCYVPESSTSHPT